MPFASIHRYFARDFRRIGGAPSVPKQAFPRRMIRWAFTAGPGSPPAASSQSSFGEQPCTLQDMARPPSGRRRGEATAGCYIGSNRDSPKFRERLMSPLLDSANGKVGANENRYHEDAGRLTQVLMVRNPPPCRPEAEIDRATILAGHRPIKGDDLFAAPARGHPGRAIPRAQFRAADGPLGSQGFRAWLRYTAVSSRLNRTRINFRTLVCPSAPLSTTVSHCASSGPSGRTIRPLGLI